MLMHFQNLLSMIGADVEKIDMDRFKHMARSLLDRRDFDEIWYLKTYPDVREAVRKNVYGSGWEHYIRDGYFDGRVPSLEAFDADEYVRKNPDVAVYVAGGDKKAKAEEHFVHFGYKEARERTPEERHLIATGKSGNRRGWIRR